MTSEVDGDSNSQSFTRCNIGQVNIYNVDSGSTLSSDEASESDVWWTQPTEKLEGEKVHNFKDKLNKQTWRNTEVAVVKSYQQENLSDPGFVVHPQIKTGFRLYQGDYVPENGFVASAQPKVGTIVTFSELMDVLQRRTHRYHAVISQAGGGKSVLLKRLARTLLEINGVHHTERFGGFLNMRKTQQFDVIFHANIKDIRNKKRITPAEVFFHPSVTGLSPLEAQHGYQAVLDGKIDLIMILDGLDQASWSVDANEKIGPWQKTTTSKIIGNLLNGHILHGVSVVISSREHCMASLPTELRPQYTAALVGFTGDDAKKLFCALMGEGGDILWEIMRFSNPGLIYTSCIPLFAIFNVIVRRLDPKEPPDSISGVMTRIIEVMLRTQHFRNHENIAKIINRLKSLAYHGTKNRTVVFSVEDLSKCGLTFEEISDIVIKVPGSNNLSEKLLTGDFLYIFGHQTLQEILAAYFICEMQYSDFMLFVDEEIRKSHWSVVTSFLCGVLKNENVRKRISPSILNIDNPEEKSLYLLRALESRLKAHSPIQKLDILVALREANVLSIFNKHMRDLNFSNFPLTTSVIHTLCSLMQLARRVPYLSLANCGIDSSLFEALASGTEGLGIEIDVLDLSGNGIWSDSAVWRKFFHNVRIRRCMISCPWNKEYPCRQTDVLTGIAFAARDEHVRELDFGHVAQLPINGSIAKQLNEAGVHGTIKCLLVMTYQNKKSSLLDWMDRKTKYQSSNSVEVSRKDFQEQICKIKSVSSISSTEALSRDDWKEFGIFSQGYLVEEIEFPFSPDLSGIHKLLSGVKHVQFQCLVLHKGRCVPYAFIKFTDRRVCLEALDQEREPSNQTRYADVIVDVEGQQSQAIGEIISKCDFEAVLVAEWPKFHAASFAAGLDGKKIRRLAVHNLDNNMVNFLRRYKATQELFINREIHDEKVCRSYSSKMKVNVLGPAFWEESFCLWW